MEMRCEDMENLNVNSYLQELKLRRNALKKNRKKRNLTLLNKKYQEKESQGFGRVKKKKKKKYEKNGMPGKVEGGGGVYINFPLDLVRWEKIQQQ